MSVMRLKTDRHEVYNRCVMHLFTRMRCQQVVEVGSVKVLNAS